MKRLPLAIWAMVIAAFAMGADEFIVAGVIEDIAADLDVTLGAVGWFESAYAIGVAIGAPLFTVLGAGAERRRMLLITATIFVLGNLISALGPSYETIMVGRVVAAMSHGAFFGIAAIYAAELVDAARKGRAIATVFAVRPRRRSSARRSELPSAACSAGASRSGRSSSSAGSPFSGCSRSCRGSAHPRTTTRTTTVTRTRTRRTPGTLTATATAASRPRISRGSTHTRSRTSAGSGSGRRFASSFGRSSDSPCGSRS